MLGIHDGIAARQLTVIKVVGPIQNQGSVIDDGIQRLIRMLGIDASDGRFKRGRNRPIRLVAHGLITQARQATLDASVVGRGNVVAFAALLGRRAKGNLVRPHFLDNRGVTVRRTTRCGIGLTGRVPLKGGEQENINDNERD